MKTTFTTHYSDHSEPILDGVSEEQSGIYISDLTRDEEQDHYDWYNFFPDASF